MNEFFKYNFNISNISTCIYVAPGAGKKIHKCRPTHGLVYECSGSKRYHFDEDSYTVSGGQVFYLPRFSNYFVQDIIKGDCIAVNFSISDDKITFPFFSLSDHFGQKYQPLFQKLLHLWTQKPIGYQNACYGILYQLIAEIQADANRQYLSPANHDLIFKAETYIHSHLSHPTLSVSEIAGYLKISPEYFRKIFKEKHGVSPRRYIILRRIETAKELILSDEVKRSEIFALVGYDSDSYFCTEFKRHTGQTPLEYKNNTENGSM